jgi:hypothetical protein
VANARSQRRAQQILERYIVTSFQGEVYGFASFAGSKADVDQCASCFGSKALARERCDLAAAFSY